MISIYTRIAELNRAGIPFVLATVVRTLGSTPQIIGAKLIVSAEASGRPAGTLGGGCVEADAIEAARAVLEGGASTLRAYELNEALAWNTGLVCGGTMWILVEPGREALGAHGDSWIDRLAQAAAGGPPAAIVTRVRKDGRELVFDGRVFVTLDGAVSGTFGDDAIDRRAAVEGAAQMRHGTPRTIAIDDTHDLLIDPVVSRPRLVIAGGGHVALAIARQALLLDFDVTVLEDRPEFATPERFAGATVVAGDVPAAIAAFDFGWHDYLVIATRGHKLDADCVLAAARTKASYIGLLGSRRKVVLIEQMLRDEGVAAERLAAIHSPVGLDLGGRTPAEIALSVLAEITQTRYASSGAPLRQA